MRNKQFPQGRRVGRRQGGGIGRSLERSLECSAATGPNLHLYDTAMRDPELRHWINKCRKGGA